MRPTVLLVVLHGFAARFLLQTEILPILREAGARVVILSPNGDDPEFRAEWEDENTHVETLFEDLGSVQRSTWRTFVYGLRRYALPATGASAAFRGKYERHHRRQLERRPLQARLQHAVLQLVWRSSAARRTLLAIEKRVYRRPLHASVFDRYDPDLVVTTSPGYWLGDAIVLREAEQRGVRSVAAVLGWDNPTSKGYRGATPTRVVAWSERMAEHLQRFHDLPADRISVGGVPHWDRYQRPSELLSRDELAELLGLDPHARIVAFMTANPTSYGENTAVAEALATAAADGRLGEDVQVVARVHPLAFRDGGVGRLDELEALAARTDRLVLDVPGLHTRGMRFEMPVSDGIRLASLVKHADVMVNVFSTTTLEAFLVDTPVVLAGHGANPAWVTYEHLRPLVESGGARIAPDLDALVAEVRAYLDDPGRDREIRLRIAREETGPLDGRSGERIGRLIADEALAAVRARRSGS